MQKFKIGDLVKIMVQPGKSFVYGGSTRDLKNTSLGNRVVRYDPDINNSYIVEITSSTGVKSNYRFSESELELFSPVKDEPVKVLVGFRTKLEGWDREVRDLSLEEISQIKNGDIAVSFAIPMIRSNSIAPRKFKIGDIVTVNRGLASLFYGGYHDVKGLRGHIVGTKDAPVSSQKTRSAQINVRFETTIYSLFESETEEFYIPSSTSGVSVTSSSQSEKQPLQSVTAIRNQGQIIRAHVGASTVIPKTRYPQVIISNTKTIIKDGRRDTGRKVQSTHF